MFDCILLKVSAVSRVFPHGDVGTDGNVYVRGWNIRENNFPETICAHSFSWHKPNEQRDRARSD
jgi:hypothetical protein